MNSDIFEKALEGLNNEQKTAVEAIEGPVMVNAGPGTGKTQILTLRIGNILKKTDIQPENILALTFTNAGVYSMRDRLRTYIGDTAYRVNIFTFHAFAEYIIKNFSIYFPRFEYSKVIDDLQKVEFIEEIIDKNSFEYLVGNHDDYQKVREIKNAIYLLKQEGYDVERFKQEIPNWQNDMMSDPKVYYSRKFKNFNVGDVKPGEEEKIKRKINIAKELAHLYEQYQLRLEKENLYDFSDMIITVVNELKANENLKLELQEQYQYILVDEHQDTNSGQNELLEILADAEHLGGRPNIFTVGDEKQSIYRFQGASEKTFSHFNEIYKDITHINLKENYRSTQNILDASHELISNSISNHVKLNSNKKENQKIKIGEFTNYKFELLYVAEDIKKKINEGISPKEIAVLYRSNKHTDDIKSVLAQNKIPFTIFSKSSIFEDYDISNIILLLRIIFNPNDEETLSKALFINFLNIDGYDAIKILQNRIKYKKEKKITLFEIISDEKILNEIGIKNSKSILDFSNNINQSIIKSKNSRLVDFLKEFIQSIGYNSYMLKSNLSRDKLFKIDKLFDEIKKQQAKKHFVLNDFISLVDSYYAYHLDIENTDPEIEEGVQLMTAHGSKGKEFEYVYIINTTSKNWEKNNGNRGILLPIKAYVGDTDDERRLFYVSMTRAKSELNISYSKTDWEGKEQEKSRFITEIPDNFIEILDSKEFEKNNIKKISLFLNSIEEKKTIYDSDFIKKLYLKRGLTVTSLNNYLACPIKYFYKNLIQIPNGYSPILEYGNLIHHSLEKYFLECKSLEKICNKKNLLKYFEDYINSTQFSDKELKKYKKKGLDALDTWFDSRKNEHSWNVDIEKKISFDFQLDSGDLLRLNGKIDKIEYLDSVFEGDVIVVDYKTGKPYSKKLKEQKEELKRQLIFYHLLIQNYKDSVYKIKEAKLDFIEQNDKGIHETFSVDVDSSNIEDLKTVIKKVSSEIMTGELLNKGCGKKDCEWCRFHS